MKSTIKECIRLFLCAVAYLIAFAVVIVLAFSFYFLVFLPLGGFVVAMGVLCLALVLALFKLLEVLEDEDLSGPHDYYD